MTLTCEYVTTQVYVFGLTSENYGAFQILIAIIVSASFDKIFDSLGAFQILIAIIVSASFDKIFDSL